MSFDNCIIAPGYGAISRAGAVEGEKIFRGVAGYKKGGGVVKNVGKIKANLKQN